MSHDLTGLAMAPRRSSGSTGTLVLLALAFALAMFAGRDTIANLASKDAGGLLGRPVSGVVVDATTGVPIAGARVTSVNEPREALTNEWSVETRTNTHGEFTVRASSDQEYDASEIQVTAPGYQDAHGPVRFDERMWIQLRPTRHAGG